MNAQLIYPMFAMVLLTLVVLGTMFFRRVSALKSGEVRLSYFKTYSQSVEADQMLQASRHFSNLFEAPVLFYVVCTLGILFSEGSPFVVIAWLYVLTRVVHAWIHLGANNVLTRSKVYGLSWIFLLSLWVLLIFHQIVPS